MTDQPALPIDGTEPKPAHLVPGANPEPVADGWVRCEYGVYWRTDKSPGSLETGTPGDVHRLLDQFRARLQAAEAERDALQARIDAAESGDPVATASALDHWHRKATELHETNQRLEAANRRLKDERDSFLTVGGNPARYIVMTVTDHATLVAERDEQRVPGTRIEELEAALGDIVDCYYETFQQDISADRPHRLGDPIAAAEALLKRGEATDAAG